MPTLNWIGKEAVVKHHREVRCQPFFVFQGSMVSMRPEGREVKKIPKREYTAEFKEQPGPILAVDYKGADRWAGAEDDRLIGGLWANLSEGRCRFVMVKDKRWEWIDEKLPRSPVLQS